MQITVTAIRSKMLITFFKMLMTLENKETQQLCKESFLSQGDRVRLRGAAELRNHSHSNAMLWPGVETSRKLIFGFSKFLDKKFFYDS